MTNTNAAAETVYAAIELSKKTWVLGIAFPDRDRPSIHRIPGGNVAELVSRLRVAARNNRRILVCYEAGYDGWPGHWRRWVSSAVSWTLRASRSIAAPAASRLTASTFWRCCVP